MTGSNSKLVQRLSTFSALSLMMVACGEPTNESSESSAAVERLRQSVYTLADSSFAGRETGTEGERAAADWISSAFEATGLTPAGDSGAFQSFSYKPHPPVQMHETDSSKHLGMAVVREIVGRNVLYALDAAGGGGSKGVGVIGAHYDHLGYGDENSLFRGAPTVHYGADDNASGVAVMLELAQRLQSNPIQDDLFFAAFSGEEKGLWGSNHFCESPTIDLRSIRYMINMDMVGRLRGDTLAVYGTGTTPKWMDILESCNEEGFVLVPSESGVGPSDHTSFYLEDIPVLHFFTGQHPDYHRPSDTPDKLNYEGMSRIADYIERVVRKLEKEPDLVFTKTKDQDKDSTPSFKVTLGVVPDYLYSGEGMRIDGVTESRPAANAGMQRGDVVVRIDTLNITDMMSYMQALSMFEADQTTEVEILRDGEDQVVTVTWD